MSNENKSLYESLHPEDRALLDGAEDLAIECHNTADKLEEPGTQSAGLMALSICTVVAGAVQARATREAVAAMVAAMAEQTAVLARIADRLE